MSVFIKGIKLSRGQIVIGRAASGGASAPEPAARHRGQTRVPTDYSQSLFPLFPPFFLFLKSDVSSF